MIATKIFKGEMSHVVRQCMTDRCAKTIHGHSFKLEANIYARNLDIGSMVSDFGEVKRVFGNFVDLFDHTYVMWDQEPEEFKEFMKSNNARWIEVNFSPSAEMLAVFFLAVLRDRVRFLNRNGEQNVQAVGCVYHETATGSATAIQEDLVLLREINFSLSPELTVAYELDKRAIGLGKDDL